MHGLSTRINNDARNLVEARLRFKWVFPSLLTELIDVYQKDPAEDRVAYNLLRLCESFSNLSLWHRFIISFLVRFSNSQLMLTYSLLKKEGVLEGEEKQNHFHCLVQSKLPGYTARSFVVVHHAGLSQGERGKDNCRRISHHREIKDLYRVLSTTRQWGFLIGQNAQLRLDSIINCSSLFFLFKTIEMCQSNGFLEDKYAIARLEALIKNPFFSDFFYLSDDLGKMGVLRASEQIDFIEMLMGHRNLRHLNYVLKVLYIPGWYEGKQGQYYLNKLAQHEYIVVIAKVVKHVVDSVFNKSLNKGRSIVFSLLKNLDILFGSETMIKIWESISGPSKPPFTLKFIKTLVKMCQSSEQNMETCRNQLIDYIKKEILNAPLAPFSRRTIGYISISGKSPLQRLTIFRNAPKAIDEKQLEENLKPS